MYFDSWGDLGRIYVFCDGAESAFLALRRMKPAESELLSWAFAEGGYPSDVRPPAETNVLGTFLDPAQQRERPDLGPCPILTLLKWGN